MNDAIRTVEKEIEKLNVKYADTIREFIKNEHSPLIFDLVKKAWGKEVPSDATYCAYVHKFVSDEWGKNEWCDINFYDANDVHLGDKEVWNRYMEIGETPPETLKLREDIEEALSTKELFHINSNYIDTLYERGCQ